MKRLKLIILLFTFTAATVYSQQKIILKRVPVSELVKPRPATNLYFYDNNLDKFVGIWIASKEGKKIKIFFFKKAFRLSADPSASDEIELMSGTIDYRDNETNAVSYELGGSIGIGSDTNILHVYITVVSRNATAELIVTYLPNGDLKVEQGPNTYESKNDKNFELKEAMILKRQR